MTLRRERCGWGGMSDGVAPHRPTTELLLRGLRPLRIIRLHDDVVLEGPWMATREEPRCEEVVRRLISPERQSPSRVKGVSSK